MELRIHAMSEVLEEPLQKYYTDFVKMEPGEKVKKVTLQRMLKRLLEFIHSRDDLFADYFIQVGSIADGTKAEAVDELDVLIPLQKDKLRVTAVDQSLNLFSIDEYVGGDWRCLAHDETISRLYELVRDYKEKYYKNDPSFAVKKKTITATALPLKIDWIKIDLVLCIENALRFSNVEWPFPKWLNGQSKWLTYQQQESVRKMGIDMTCHGIHWRPSFSRIDAYLLGKIDSKGGYRKKAFKIFKSLNGYYWTKDQLCKDYQGKSQPFLGSFMTKILYLHAREKYPESQHWNSLGKSFCNFLDVLNQCCNEKCLDHYYQTNSNLFEYVAGETFLWLQENIRNILQNPEEELS
ncbi:protein mab-21-like 3 [Hemiscyllium ocellatum]|uniref:protein mab-21-like 3 n=1 Tax=Hemiscyllium ocellatum TaxID=170820 RepID=UPI0029670B49|nr:protein mab-21-like 3 [Hemiscyllium ocellatum]